MSYGLLEVQDSPAPQPLITLEEAKAHLSVDISKDDALIRSLVSAATHQAESYTGRRFVSRDFVLTLDGFPPAHSQPYLSRSMMLCNPFPQAIYFPIYPVVSVSEIRCQSVDYVNGQQQLAAQTVTGTLDRASVPARLVPAFGEVWPETAHVPGAVSITFTAGYGTPDQVPEDFKDAVKVLLGTLYENREDIVIGTIAAEVPYSHRAMLARYRLFM